eukprot:g15113.t1
MGLKLFVRVESGCYCSALEIANIWASGWVMGGPSESTPLEWVSSRPGPTRTSYASPSWPTTANTWTPSPASTTTCSCRGGPSNDRLMHNID